MTAATAPVTREILLDRWDSVMEWHRTGGDASPQYEALVGALQALTAVVAGQDDNFDNDVTDDDLLAAIGGLIVDRIEALGIAR